MSVTTLKHLVANRNRITAIHLEVVNALGHHNIKAWFNDNTFMLASTRSPYEPKVYKSLSASLAIIKKLGFIEFKVVTNGF